MPRSCICSTSWAGHHPEQGELQGPSRRKGLPAQLDPLQSPGLCWAPLLFSWLCPNQGTGCPWLGAAMPSVSPEVSPESPKGCCPRGVSSAPESSTARAPLLLPAPAEPCPCYLRQVRQGGAGVGLWRCLSGHMLMHQTAHASNVD